MDAYTLRHMRTLPVGHLRYAAREMAYYGHDPYNNHARLAYVARDFIPVTYPASGAVVVLPNNRIM